MRRAALRIEEGRKKLGAAVDLLKYFALSSSEAEKITPDSAVTPAELKTARDRPEARTS